MSALHRDLGDFVRLEVDEAALERLEWRRFGKGVELGRLARDGEAGLVLYRIAANAPRDAFARHAHPGGEAYLVLEGVIGDEFGRYEAGSFVWLPRDSSHAPWAEGETLVLVLWPESVRVDKPGG